jgi:hypothetical protein
MSTETLHEYMKSVGKPIKSEQDMPDLRAKYSEMESWSKAYDAAVRRIRPDPEVR